MGSSRGSPEPDAPERPSGYWHASRRPLQILVFLLPLIVAYELCLGLVLSLDVQAHKGLLEFFAALGVTRTGGLYLGGLVIVAVLLVWHVLVRDPWRASVRTAGGMAIEALVLALPLIVLSRIIAVRLPAAGTPADVAFVELDLWSQLAISVGAGLYEELMFRMVLIAVVHTLLVDVGKTSHHVGAAIAIGLSALAFTWYHDLRNASGGISVAKLAFYFLAGVYFGAVYMVRGFGLVVGAHATYDILTVILARLASDP
jgi:hypothetical protein